MQRLVKGTVPAMFFTATLGFLAVIRIIALQLPPRSDALTEAQPIVAKVRNLTHRMPDGAVRCAMAKNPFVIVSCQMAKKPPRQASPRLPSQAEPRAPLFPSDAPSPKASVRQPSARELKRELQGNTRKLHERNWLAAAGSVQEKQFLKRWAKQKELSQKDRDLIYKWIDNPDEFAKRNVLFWQAAKKSVLGPVVYETAMERQRTLGDKEWLVACFTAAGLRQEDIAKLTGIGQSMVDKVICTLKDKITQELECNVERAQIARWFLGL